MKAATNDLARHRMPLGRRAVIVLGAIFLAGVVVFALSQLNLPRVGHALITATPGWIVLALLLMGSSLVLRSISWQQTCAPLFPTSQSTLRPLHGRQ